MHSYELHFHELGLGPDYDPARDVFMATGPELTVPELNRANVIVLSEVDPESMPSHDHQDLPIKLVDGKQLLWSPIFNLSKKKLDTLRFYLKVQLKQGLIRPSMSPAGAPVFFMLTRMALLGYVWIIGVLTRPGKTIDIHCCRSVTNYWALTTL
jgi:hypothetical protein